MAETRRLLKRPERRQALITAAARAFVHGGFAATSLDDVAAEAGVSRVLIYRHFESKTELYDAVLEDVAEQLKLATGYPDLDPSSVQSLVAAAQQNPDGFRLFFRQSVREREFNRHAEELRIAMKTTAEPYLREMFPDPQRLAWAAELIPTIAIEAVIAWLDAGEPSPETAGDTITQIVGAAVISISAGDKQ